MYFTAPFCSPDSNRPCRIRRSVKACCGVARGSRVPALTLRANASISSCTPVEKMKSFCSSPSFPDSALFTAFTDVIDAVTLPFVVTISISHPDLNSVPKEMLNDPLRPDLVARIAWTVSTGASFSSNKAVKAARETMSWSKTFKRYLSPATKWMPPSSRKPPWYSGVFRLLSSVLHTYTAEKTYHSVW